MKTLNSEPGRIGKRGTLVIAAPLREEYGLKEGQEVIQEPTPDGVLIRPALSVPVRRYSQAEKAAFILNGAVTDAEYAEAVKEVEAMGLDPTRIRHRRSK